jgi:hypothetical protein
MCWEKLFMFRAFEWPEVIQASSMGVAARSASQRLRSFDLQNSTLKNGRSTFEAMTYAGAFKATGLL